MLLKTWKEVSRFMPITLWVLCILLPLNQARAANDFTSIHTITTAEHAIVKDGGAMPPPFKVSYQIQLPHDAHPPLDASSWYLIRFDKEEINQDSLGLYLPKVNMNAAIYLNGYFIGSTGHFEEPMSRFWHTPVQFYLPNAALVDGENKLHIRLKASLPNDLTQLGVIQLGQLEQIQTLYQDEFFSSYTIHLMTLSAALFLGCVVLYLWFIRRLDEYLFFALSAITWAISTLNYVVHNPVVSTHTWEWMANGMLGCMPIFIMLFIRRVIGKQKNTFEYIVGFTLLAFLIILSIVPDQYFFTFTHVFYFFAISMAMYSVYLVFKDFLVHRTNVSFIMSLGFLTVGIFAIHDYFVVTGVLGTYRVFLLDYSFPLLLLSIAILLIRRFVDASLGLERANATLEARVEDAEKRIEQSYQVIAAYEATKAVESERTRIFSDLHDDLGAKLLSLVYKSETGEQKLLAKSAMDGLREIVKRSPLEHLEHNSPSISWKKEGKQRALELGVSLSWRQNVRTEYLQLKPEKMVQLGQVLREALSNAFKHGDGEVIVVNIQYRTGNLLMSVRNQGKTFVDNLEGSGINNMKRRLESMGGKIRWRSGKKGGCHVIWVMPAGLKP